MFIGIIFQSSHIFLSILQLILYFSKTFLYYIVY